MKILWFSNCPLIESDMTSTGTWIQSMADGLLDMGSVKLGVIAVGNVPEFTRQDYRQVPQWVVPISSLDKKGLPSDGILIKIVNTIDNFAPDLIHVWGVESFWGLIKARKYIKVPALLEMQGIKKVVSKYITADLTFFELIQCVGMKEFLKRRIIVSQKKEFLKWGKLEEEIIKGHKYIDVQSDWMSAQVKSIHNKASLLFVDLALRKSFYSARPWLDYESEREIKGERHNIFISSSGAIPYKGIHVAIRAMAELKNKYPEARLRIAGNFQKKGFRQDGYMHWLNQLIRKLDLTDKIDWLGSLNASQIIDELQHCGLNLVCSFVESYCLALAEPMYLGVPCVTSFTGGTSWIAKDNTNALFYSAGDAVMCAHQIARIFNDSELRNKLSNSAREVGLKRHNIDGITQNQLLIYKRVIEDSLI